MKNYRNILSIAVGSTLPFLMGLILYPIVRIVFDKYFHLFEEGTKTDDLIVSITLILWVFVASVSGGIASTVIAKTNEWIYTFLSMIMVFIILAIITRGAIFQDSTTVSIFMITMIPIGFLSGKMIGSLIKRMRKKKMEKLISSIPSSQTGTAEQ